MQRITNQKNIIYCDLRPNHSFLHKSQKTQKLKYLESDRIYIQHVIDKNVTERVLLFNSRTKKIKTIFFSTF